MKSALNLCLFGESAPVGEQAAEPCANEPSAEAAAAVSSPASAEAPEITENICSENTNEPSAPAQAQSVPDAHFAELERQAEALRATFPTFDLQAELRNPLFARMTAPDVGIGVEDAYYTVHRKEIHAAAVREASEKTAERLSNAIRSGSRRPIESGVSAQAPSVSTFDYARASKEQREAFKKDIRARMARGEKIYPAELLR